MDSVKMLPGIRAAHNTVCDLLLRHRLSEFLIVPRQRQFKTGLPHSAISPMPDAVLALRPLPQQTASSPIRGLLPPPRSKASTVAGVGLVAMIPWPGPLVGRNACA